MKMLILFCADSRPAKQSYQQAISIQVISIHNKIRHVWHLQILNVLNWCCVAEVERVDRVPQATRGCTTVETEAGISCQAVHRQGEMLKITLADLQSTPFNSNTDSSLLPLIRIFSLEIYTFNTQLKVHNSAKFEYNFLFELSRVETS